MKKSIIRTLTVSALGVGALAGLSACGSVQGAVYTPGTPVKVGIICLHDSSSTYDKNFLDALDTAVTNLGASKVVLEQNCIITGVAEDENCYTAAKDLVKKGCNLIFADSFGHQDYMLKAAKEWSTVQFCHATGTNAKTANLDNYHNAFASVYQGRFLAGVAAGIKLGINYIGQTTIPEAEAKVGYVGAYPYAEVKSGYTSWYLGVKQGVELCGLDASNVKMDVKFTNSWYSPDGEAAAADALIAGGCKIISQHADSMGAPGACENHNPVIPNVTYNVITKTDCPKSYLAYSRINWAPYYENAVNSLFAGNTTFTGESNHNWTGTLTGGSVEYDVNFDNITTVPATKAMLQTAFNAMKETVAAFPESIFGVENFTVSQATVDAIKQKGGTIEIDANGHLTSYKADTDGDYVGDTEVILPITIQGEAHNYFAESKYCSAPCFDIDIEGITLKQ